MPGDSANKLGKKPGAPAVCKGRRCLEAFLGIESHLVGLPIVEVLHVAVNKGDVVATVVAPREIQPVGGGCRHPGRRVW